jgi:hypothetical protein
MVGKIRNITLAIVIPLTIFMSFGLISIGLPQGILILIGIDVVIFLFMDKKEKSKARILKISERVQDGIEVGGFLLNEVGKAGGKATVAVTDAAITAVKTAWEEGGGRQGAQERVKLFGEFLTEVGILGVHTTVAAGKLVVECSKAISEDIMQAIEEEKQKKEKTKQLESYNEFVDLVEDISYKFLDDD